MAKQVAKLNYVKMAPRKVRLVADSIRGLSVNEAEAQLVSQHRRAAKALLKLLRSAVASAEHIQRLSAEKLFIENIRVDEGPMLKRSLPRARGIATLIQKKMSNVTLVLGESDTLPTPRFTIAVPKKTKLPSTKAKKKKQERPEAEGEAVSPKPRRPGFFKRIFSRKAGMGK